jgi:hypothetical protein
MPALSFSGCPRRGAFWYLIGLKQKNQTIRTPRKNPIKKGDKLTFYWKQRVPKHKKSVHLLGTAECIAVKTVRYVDFAHSNEIARSDGFTDHFELQEWFGDPFENGHIMYQMILWGDTFKPTNEFTKEFNKVRNNLENLLAKMRKIKVNFNNRE